MRKVRVFWVFFRNYPDVNVSKIHWDRTFFFFFHAWHLKVLLGCKTKKKKNVVKTLHYSVTYLGNEASFSLTHVTHTVTRSEVKLTLLTRRWDANGLSLCITDPMPLLHLRSPLPCPAGLCPSQLHPRHPTRLCTFLFSLSYFPTFSLIFFVSLLPEEHSLKVFTQSQK